MFAEAAFGGGGCVFREEPEVDGNLRAVEELVGEMDLALNSYSIRVLHFTLLR